MLETTSHKEQAIEREESMLATYAASSRFSKGRRVQEKAPSMRTEFARDRDRIVHSSAFRRLEYKTQVFVNHEGDHYRTRLTHTLEAAQIGRALAKSLALNDVYTEAVILAHDLGHTPFGHAGERVMNELMKNYGGFEHNLQSLRVVEVLESRYPHFEGLNLTYEVREGIAKHSTPYDLPEALEKYRPDDGALLEAQIADLADEIAYNNHDVDDGLKSGLLSWDSLCEVELFGRCSHSIKKEFPGVASKDLKHVTISRMIHTLVSDLITHSQHFIEQSGLKSLDDVRSLKSKAISFSPEILKLKNELKDYLMENMYLHWRVVRMEEKAKRVLTDIFNAFMQRPDQIPVDFRSHYQDSDNARMVCDYLAGMTDRFAIDEHQKLFNPHVKV